MPVRLGPFYVAHPIRSIETRSRPRLLAATRHGFTFYVADPVSSIREQNEPVSGPLLHYEV